MKLYTEEQVIDFTMSMISQYEFGNKNIWNKELLKESLDCEKNPIELPSDEEIEKYINSFPYTKHLDDGQYNDGVMVGAELAIEWYREQLRKKQ